MARSTLRQGGGYQRGQVVDVHGRGVGVGAFYRGHSSLLSSHEKAAPGGAAKACRFLFPSQSLSGLSPRGHTLILGGLRIGPVPVGGRRAVLDVEDQQYDPPDERDERDENPPARTIYIVKPPNRYGNTRDQDRQTKDGAQQT